jgi:uncharacterized membrane protein YphA (DoxX/SURF4 family)
MKAKLFDSHPKTSLTWISMLRIMLGLMFLTTWFSNMNKGFYTSDGLFRFFTEVFPQSENPLPFYALFIDSVILPIRVYFAPFQLISEFILGMALLLGGFSRLFSIAGIFFLANTFLATFGRDWPWAYLLPIGILVVVFFSNAGRAWGLDGFLLKRFGARGFLLW